MDIQTWIGGQKMGQGTGSDKQGRGNTVTDKQGQGV